MRVLRRCWQRGSGAAPCTYPSQELWGFKVGVQGIKCNEGSLGLESGQEATLKLIAGTKSAWIEGLQTKGHAEFLLRRLAGTKEGKELTQCPGPLKSGGFRWPPNAP